MPRNFLRPAVFGVPFVRFMFLSRQSMGRHDDDGFVNLFVVFVRTAE